jgi:glycosyltransferase involved in cell wall biosynthesis
VYDILYAWKQFQSNYLAQDAVLLIIGSGPEKAILTRLLKEKNIAHVYFIDYLANDYVRALYAISYCLVLASVPTEKWQEQFGFVLAEAIMRGCPVIGTYCGAIPEVVGSAGILVPPANPPTLARALIQIMDVHVYDSLKQQCQEEKNKFTAERFCKQMNMVYEGI